LFVTFISVTANRDDKSGKRVGASILFNGLINYILSAVPFRIPSNGDRRGFRWLINMSKRNMVQIKLAEP
jgi:hypothetical protein